MTAARCKQEPRLKYKERQNADWTLSVYEPHERHARVAKLRDKCRRQPCHYY